MISFYRKKISSGATIASIAFLLAFLNFFLSVMRIDTVAVSHWSSSFFYFDSLSTFQNNLIVLSSKFIIALIISYLTTYLTWSFSLIRHRSWLPFTFILCLLGSPLSYTLSFGDFLACTITYTSFLVASRLFQATYAQTDLFSMGILWGITSLLDPILLPFALLIGIAMPLYRIFTLRNVLAFVLGLLFVCWNTWCVSLFLNVDIPISDTLPKYTPLWEYTEHHSLLQIVSLGVMSILWIVSFLQFQANRQKDKIKTRIPLLVLFYLSVVFLISFALFSNEYSLLLLSTLLFSIPLAHFFAYSSSKIKILSLYALIVAYLVAIVLYHAPHFVLFV